MAACLGAWSTIHYLAAHVQGTLASVRGRESSSSWQSCSSGPSTPLTVSREHPPGWQQTCVDVLHVWRHSVDTKRCNFCTEHSRACHSCAMRQVLRLCDICTGLRGGCIGPCRDHCWALGRTASPTGLPGTPPSRNVKSARLWLTPAACHLQVWEDHHWKCPGTAGADSCRPGGAGDPGSGAHHLRHIRSEWQSNGVMDRRAPQAACLALAF